MDPTVCASNFVYKFWENMTETAAMIRRAFGEGSAIHKYLNGIAKLTGAERGDIDKELSQEHANNFL
jgi:hypothetical protein